MPEDNNDKEMNELILREARRKQKKGTLVFNLRKGDDKK